MAYTIIPLYVIAKFVYHRDKLSVCVPWSIPQAGPPKVANTYVRLSKKGCILWCTPMRHAREMHTREMSAREVHPPRDTQAYEIHANEIHAP